MNGEPDDRAGRAPAIAWVALGTLVIASALGCGALSFAHVFLPPSSDDAAGISLLGMICGVLGDLVAVGTATVALIVGRGRRPTVAWVALTLGLLAAALTPIGWLVWVVAAAPVFVH